jgi:WD40 repeat protein
MTHTDRREKVVIVTSEPLSDNHTDWVAVPPNNILVVTPDLHLLLAPIGSSASMSLALENIMSMERRLLPQELKDALGPVASRAVLGGMEGGREGGRKGCRSQNESASNSPQKVRGEEGGEEEGGGVIQRARHVILGHSESALALAVSGHYLFSGSQDGSIRVWNIETFTLDGVVPCADEGHSVLALVVHKDVLYTTSSDNKLRAWGLAGGEGGEEGGGCIVLLGVVFIEGMGHPISLAVAAAPGEEEEGGREGGGSANGDETIYMGFQDTSVRRVQGSAVRFPPFLLPSIPLSLPTPPHTTDPSSPLPLPSPSSSLSSSPSPHLHQHLRPPKSGSSSSLAPPPPPPPFLSSTLSSSSPPFHPERLGLGDFESHHCGPVTALTVYPPYIVSGAGDGFVKVWSPSSRTCFRTLQGHHGSVLTLLAGREEGVVISGSRDGTIKVWDMESFSCRRTLRGHNDDVLSLAIWAGFLFSGAADGGIVVWRLDTLTFYRAFQQAEQAIQSLVVSSERHQLLFSGLEGGMVLAWDMPHEVSSGGGMGRSC